MSAGSGMNRFELRDEGALSYGELAALRAPLSRAEMRERIALAREAGDMIAVARLTAALRSCQS